MSIKRNDTVIEAKEFLKKFKEVQKQINDDHMTHREDDKFE